MTYDIIGNGVFWLAVFITTFICIVPFLIIRRAESHFSETIINNIKKNRFQKDYTKKLYLSKIKTVTKYRRSVAKFKRIFKQDENVVVDNYADKRMKDIVALYRSNKLAKNPSQGRSRNLEGQEMLELRNRQRSNSENRLDKGYTVNLMNRYGDQFNNNYDGYNYEYNRGGLMRRNSENLMDVTNISGNREVNLNNMDFLNPNPSKFYQ